MIPDNLSFHDSVISGIECDGTNCIVAIEDVVVGEVDDVVSGTLVIEDIRTIAVDGRPGALAMQGDDGEIVHLREETPGLLDLFVIWPRYDTKDETQAHYRIECGAARWTQAE